MSQTKLVLIDKKRRSVLHPTVLITLVAVAALVAAPVQAGIAAQYSDSLPADASDICGITNQGVLLVFIGDGASETCQAKAHPVDIGPGGWSDVADEDLGDLVGAQHAPECTFHLAVTPPLLTRVYAPAPSSFADAICAGITQFFPSVEASQGAAPARPPAGATNAGAANGVSGDLTGEVASGPPGTPITVTATVDVNVTSMVDKTSKPRDVFAIQLGNDADYASGRPQFVSFYFSSPNSYGGSFINFRFIDPPDSKAVTSPPPCGDQCPVAEIGNGTDTSGQPRCNETSPRPCFAVRLFSADQAFLVITAEGANQRYSMRVHEGT